MIRGRNIRQTKLGFPAPEYENPIRAPPPVKGVVKHYRQSRIIKLFHKSLDFHENHLRDMPIYSTKGKCWRRAVWFWGFNAKILKFKSIFVFLYDLLDRRSVEGFVHTGRNKPQNQPIGTTIRVCTVCLSTIQLYKRVRQVFFFRSNLNEPSPRETVGGVAQWLLRRSVAGGLSLIYGWRVTTLWVRRPLWVNQLGQLSLPSLLGR